MKKKILTCLISLLGVVIGLSCTPRSSIEEKSVGDFLIISESQTPSSINPLLTSTTFSANLSDIIFDSLVNLDEHFEVKPKLLASWEPSENGLIWNFVLKKGIHFHDGEELNAEDVVFTFEKIQSLPRGSPFNFIFQFIKKISKTGEYKFQIELERPNSSFLQSLDFGILPKHRLEGEDLLTTPFNKHPIGTGPFNIKTWSKKEIALKANPDYFLGRPFLDGIIVNFFLSQEAAWAKLIAGEVDFFFFLTPRNFASLKQVPSFNVFSVPKPYYYLIAFNLENDLFSDKKIRQALNYAVNKKEIIEKVLHGQGEVAQGTIFPGSWAFDPEVDPYEFNPQKAIALLKEAGWEDRDGDYLIEQKGKPFEFSVHVNRGDDLKEKTLLLVQQHLYDIGIKMNITLFDAAQMDFLFKKQFQSFFPEITDRGNPDFSYKHWHSSQMKNGFNVSSYMNPKVDRFLEEGRVSLDSDERRKAYFKYQKEIREDPPGIYLFWTNYLVGIHNRFRGVKISSLGPLSNVREWYVPKQEQKHSVQNE